MNRGYIKAFCLMLLFASNCHAQSANGYNKLSAVVDAKKIIIELTYAPPKGACVGWRWGAENSCPLEQIESLKVSVSGQDIYVPRSAYADLGQPKSVKIVEGKDKETFEVVILGGDAAVSYRAKLFFTAMKIVRRDVYSLEFTDDAWERTIYSFP